MTYTFVGRSPDTLANGRPLAFGDHVSFTKAQAAANERLIRAGLLVQASAARKGAPHTDSEEE